MAEPKRGTIRVRWIRSGIAFNRKQREIIRGLGLRRLHDVVERPDTPVVRGLIAKVAHLVEVVGPARQPAWASVREYTLVPAQRAPDPGDSGGTPSPALEAAGNEGGGETGQVEAEAPVKPPKRRSKAKPALATPEGVES